MILNPKNKQSDAVYSVKKNTVKNVFLFFLAYLIIGLGIRLLYYPTYEILAIH